MDVVSSDMGKTTVVATSVWLSVIEVVIGRSVEWLSVDVTGCTVVVSSVVSSSVSELESTDCSVVEATSSEVLLCIVVISELVT